MTNRKFWWQLRLYWAAALLLYAFVFGLFLSLIVTGVTVVFYMPTQWDSTTIEAVWEIGAFWFKVAWSLAFSVAILLAFWRLFNRKLFGYRLLYLNCQRKDALIPLYPWDVMTLWRKFLLWQAWIGSFVALVLLLGVQLPLAALGGWKIFAWVLGLGMAILKPLLSSSVKVRITKE
ncbi:MAG: hypothetical protein KU37_07595 [Sulfuricurvum sp. PC08-66]|nr:MAG: hypothetical protein KU37_07595 [Sulfuricurvum sp. PC08-66]